VVLKDGWDGLQQLERWVERFPPVTQAVIGACVVLVIATPLFALSASSFGDALAHTALVAVVAVISTLAGGRIAQRRRR